MVHLAFWFFIVLFMFIVIFRPLLEWRAVKKWGKSSKRIQFFVEQSLFYIIILLGYMTLFKYEGISFSFMGWKATSFSAFHASPLPSFFKYLILALFAFFIITVILVAWIKRNKEANIFGEETLASSYHVFTPQKKEEVASWSFFSCLHVAVESLVYFPFFYFLYVHIFHVTNIWLVLVFITCAYYVVQLAFSYDRLSIQPFIIGLFLSSLYVLTESVLPLLLFYICNFVLEIYHVEEEFQRQKQA